MVLSLLITCLIIQGIFWLSIFPRLAFHKSNLETSNIKISVVVSIKNEIGNLPQLLDFLIHQDYDPYEIILVDDFSSDGSLKYLQKGTGVKVIKASLDKPGKKQALQEGIKAAVGEYILVTDGDCRGMSRFWIDRMAGSLSSKQIVLGYGPLSFTNKVGALAAFETWMIAIQYFSYTLWRIPYMGVGRNLLFSKELFNQNRGYQNHLDLSSGDDDLLIQEIATGKNVTICLDPESYVFSEAPHSLRQLITQKRRHLTTAPRYQWYHQLMLSLWASSFLLLYPLLGWFGMESENWLAVGTIFSVVLVMQWIVALVIGWRMKEFRFVLFFPLFYVGLWAYYWTLVPFLFFKKNVVWKS